MSRSSFPQRAVWPKLFPAFSYWSGVLGVLSFVISVIVIGVPYLSWWAKAAVILVVFVVAIFGLTILKIVSTIYQRVKQYDLLYDGLRFTVSDVQRLQANLEGFILNLKHAGLQMFDVTGVEWVNPYLLLEITCNQKLPLGSKLVVIEVSTSAALGRFTVVQAASGGYFAREEMIFDALWWGFWHDQATKYAHPRMHGNVAILLQ